MENNNKDIKKSRFSDAIWFKEMQKASCIIGGVGGIGSWLTLFLSRAGMKLITIYDDDIFEENNLGGQFVSEKNIGMLKVSSVATDVNDFGGTSRIIMQPSKFTKYSYSESNMFSCFDNMKARKKMFDRWLATTNIYRNNIFIDGRLLFEKLDIFCIKRDDNLAIEKYQNEYLYTDEEVPDAVCTVKQTTHTAAMIASLMTGYFTNHLGNLSLNTDATFKVPFHSSYYIPLNNLENEEKVIGISK